MSADNVKTLQSPEKKPAEADEGRFPGKGQVLKPPSSMEQSSSSSTSDETDGQSENNLSVDLKKRIKGENVKYSAKLESEDNKSKTLSTTINGITANKNVTIKPSLVSSGGGHTTHNFTCNEDIDAEGDIDISPTMTTKKQTGLTKKKLSKAAEPTDGCFGKPAKRAKTEESYKMTSKPRGQALVIINSFENTTKQRNGHEAETKNLGDLFRFLGFEVSFAPNLSADGIMRKVKQFAKSEEHKDCDMSVVVISSHGDEGIIEGEDRNHVKEKELLKFFEGEKNLKGKPKLFMFNTCRGKKKIKDVSKDGPSGVRDDFIIVHSTIKDHVSYREKNGNDGSLFIKCLCEVFMKHAHNKEILEMLRLVKAKLPEEVKQDRETEYQLCDFTPQNDEDMKKKLYFNPTRPKIN